MTFITILPHLWIVPLAAIIPAGLAVLWFWIASHYRENWWSTKWHNERQKPRYQGDRYSSRDEGSGYALGGWVWVGVTTFVIVVASILLIPYQPKYWAFYNIHGTVTKLTRAIDHGSGDLSESVVARVSGYDQPIVMTDDRIFDYQGKDVTLICTISWVPYGMDKTSCGLAGGAR